MLKTTYRIPKEQLACRFGHHWMEDLAGDGGPRCPMFECNYDGEILPLETCEENSNCPAFQPEQTTICGKHDYEFTDWCKYCHPDAEEWS